MTSPLFARAWVQANTAAHKELVYALTAQGNGTIGISNGQVTLSLGPFITTVKQDLVERGFTLANNIPAINPTFALFSAKYLVKARTAYRVINDLKIVLPILTLLLLGLGVYVARGHRRALIGASLGLAASMLLLGAGLLIFRGAYLNSVPASVLPADAAAALFDTLVRFIKEGLRTILVLGLVVAAGAFLTGPSLTAVKTRAAFASGLGWVRAEGEHAGLRTGPVGACDVCAQDRAAHLSRGARRPDLRVLGPANGPRGDCDHDRAAGSARADRTDRQASQPAADRGTRRAGHR